MQAAFWAQAFAELGIPTRMLPLIEIQAKSDTAATQARLQTLSHLGQYQAIMHVSPNAALHFWDAAAQHAWHAWHALQQAHGLGTPYHPRLWSPGPGTTQALISLGFPQEAIDQPHLLESSQFDSEALWHTVQRQITGPCRVLIVRGSTISAQTANAPPTPQALSGSGRNWLSHTLQQQGANVEFLSVYERRPPHWDAAHKAIAMAAAQAPYVWLFNSSEAVEHLTGHFPGHDWGLHQAIATHPRIAQTLKSQGFQHISTCLPTAAAIAHALRHDTAKP